MSVIAVRVVLFVPLLVLIAQAAAAQTANNPRLVEMVTRMARGPGRVHPLLTRATNSAKRRTSRRR